MDKGARSILKNFFRSLCSRTIKLVPFCVAAELFSSPWAHLFQFAVLQWDTKWHCDQSRLPCWKIYSHTVTCLHANSTHHKLHAVVPLRVRFTGARKPWRHLNQTILWQLADISMRPCPDYIDRADVVNHLPVRRKNMLLTTNTIWFKDSDSLLSLYKWSTSTFALKPKPTMVKQANIHASLVFSSSVHEAWPCIFNFNHCL